MRSVQFANGFVLAVQLSEIRRDGFGRGPKKPAQLRLDVELPLRAELRFRCFATAD